MAPPAATTTTTDATTTAPSLGDMEDLGSVVVTQKCTGCVVCRVLAPDVFLEAHAGSRDPTVRYMCVHVCACACFGLVWFAWGVCGLVGRLPVAPLGHAQQLHPVSQTTTTTTPT